MNSLKQVPANKVNVTVLCGLPGSGKSTWGQSYITVNPNTILLSSDKIRKELYNDEGAQIAHSDVFALLYTRARDGVKSGKNVIIDSTAINRKTRTKALEKFKDLNCSIECIFFATDWEACVKRDAARKRVVGKDSILEIMKRFEFPTDVEGFDSIRVIRGSNEDGTIKGTDLNKYIGATIGYDQNTPHHNETLDKHIARTVQYCIDNNYSKELIEAAKYHDLGKPLCRVNRIREDGLEVSSYACHANVGAYLYACSDVAASTNADVHLITYYINTHMLTFHLSDAGRRKLLTLVGEDRVRELELLSIADSQRAPEAE